MSDWQVGDAALCIKDGVCPVRGALLPIHKGTVYTVTIVRRVKDDFGEDRLALGLAGFGNKVGWNAICFRKITPPAADEFDRETIALMNLAPNRETVNG